ncbi:lyase family protein, partial [Streptomyces sp. NPDC001193]
MTASSRTEHDLLGDRDVPADAYWGVHTLRATENFPITGTPISTYPHLIDALAAVKEAAALANGELGLLEPTKAAVIVAACQEIRGGELHDQFVVDVIQGGAGTSTNMNANEVIANRALELLGHSRGENGFWAGWGITIMDAWGLTETSGVCTINSPDGFRLGSVGRPIEGLELRLAEDGEILTRGATVFAGYLRPDGSVESAHDAEGWFPTGDVGRLDEDGFLWLTDRKKELIITSNGKNVSPALVENTVKEHPLIGQALVHGDGRSYLVALLVLDGEVAPAWAAARGIEAGPLAGLAEHPAVREEIAAAVAAANARLNRTEQIKRYRLLTEEWG